MFRALSALLVGFWRISTPSIFLVPVPCVSLSMILRRLLEHLGYKRRAVHVECLKKPHSGNFTA